jgi:tetratricopeptide (TPR) repeat protein
MHARIVRAHMVVLSASSESVAAATEVVNEGNRLFGLLDDARGLAAVAVLEAELAWVGSNAAATVAAVERAIEHAQRVSAGELVGRSTIVRYGPIVWGPFTPAEMRARVAELPDTAHPRLVIEGNIAQREGRLDEALACAERMVMRLTELGLRVLVTAPMNARAHLLGELGRHEESVKAYEDVIALHESLGQAAHLSTTLVEYGEMLYGAGDAEEAERLATEGERLGGPEDVVNFSKGRGVRARIAADRGDDVAAVELAQSAVEYAERTDFPSEHGRAYEALGHVHRRAGRADDARAAYAHALEVWERYGFTADAGRIRGLLAEL